jgi:hypothetical protein
VIFAITPTVLLSRHAVLLPVSLLSTGIVRLGLDIHCRRVGLMVAKMEFYLYIALLFSA